MLRNGDIIIEQSHGKVVPGTGIAMQLRIICTIEKTHRYRYFICSTGTVPVAMKFLNKYGAVTAYALILNLSKSAENVFLQVVTFQR
jgi:hypothetical protein